MGREQTGDRHPHDVLPPVHDLNAVGQIEKSVDRRDRTAELIGSRFIDLRDVNGGGEILGWVHGHAHQSIPAAADTGAYGQSICPQIQHQALAVQYLLTHNGHRDVPDRDLPHVGVQRGHIDPQAQGDEEGQNHIKGFIFREFLPHRFCHLFST